MNFKNISGAQSLVIIFVCASFLTRFNLPLNLVFIFFIIYCTIYLLFNFVNKNRSNKSSLIVVSHYLILCYLLVVFLMSKFVNLNLNSLPHFWDGQSVLVLVSVLLAHIVVLKTPNNHIVLTLEFIKKISYFMILESIVFFAIPDNLNIFRSDFEAGYRFISLLTPGYSFTGLFIILGYTAHLHLDSLKSKQKIFLIFLFFCFALIQTKDRTSILTFILINLFVLYKSASSKTLLLSSVKKITFVVKLILMVSIVYFSMISLIDRKNILSISSPLDRYMLFVRGVSITKEVLPIGGGPGSQVRLMYNNTIPFDGEIYNIALMGENINNKIDSLKDDSRKRIALNLTISPHNTYLDYTISLGVVGILISLFILFVQFKSFCLLIINRGRSAYFLEAMFVSSFILLMNVSFINSMWLFIIMYRAYKVNDLQSNKLYES